MNHSLFLTIHTKIKLRKVLNTFFFWKTKSLKPYKTKILNSHKTKNCRWNRERRYPNKKRNPCESWKHIKSKNERFSSDGYEFMFYKTKNNFCSKPKYKRTKAKTFLKIEKNGRKNLRKNSYINKFRYGNNHFHKGKKTTIDFTILIINTIKITKKCQKKSSQVYQYRNREKSKTCKQRTKNGNHKKRTRLVARNFT